MAVNINSRGGVPGAAPPVVSDINVTPLVDVMLVLLIVFMVASQLAASGVKVDLPKSNAKPLTEPLPPVVVTIDAQGQVYVNQDAVDGGSLVAALARHTGGDKERRVHLRGDQKLSYGLVVKTMGQVTDAGYSRIALVSETPPN
ncbi:biopolymer transporter ExbD [Paucibacter sp. R3-3]|uniref:Biopolymer transporter ExbD n=1 Tax=Roseateles agri TaxID=3098619 RepID=A0ABU5DRK3_9BURK|nr:biopolymer transporter ExbD [Paucibacter sp. R3-3]MDY0747672.1 biopolymer transporter ExbD [Paucibacter sp. R3-3]